jgi:cation-transporting P-type ATPase I
MASAAALANGTRIAAGLARRPLPVWREVVPWHELEPSEALDRLGTSLAGLSEEEATLRRPPETPSPSGTLLLARSVAAELLNPLTPVLGAGAGLAAAIGSVTDAALIGSIMVLNALVGGVEGYRATVAVERLEGGPRAASWSGAEVRNASSTPLGLSPAMSSGCAPERAFPPTAGSWRPPPWRWTSRA